MKLLEELLPFAILVAISVLGKYMEMRKQKRAQQSQAPDLDRDEQMDEIPDDSCEPDREGIPRMESLPSPVEKRVSEPSPAAPPVMDMPPALKNILRAMGIENSKPEPPPVPKPEVKHVPVVHRVSRPVVDVPAEVHKPLLTPTPDAVRMGLLWKTVLDEPRGRKAWQPMR